RLSRGVPSALPLPKDGEPVTVEDDAWLARVNGRVEAERQRRLGLVEEGPGTGELSGRSGGGADDRAARLARLAVAAESQGYSLERLERLVGIDGGGSKKN